MKILSGNTLYEFTVTQDAAESGISQSIDLSIDEFRIQFQYRKFHAPSRSPELEQHRSHRFPRPNDGSSERLIMANILNEFDIPDRARQDMADHFQFYIQMLTRRNSSTQGVILVTVSLDAKVMRPERAAAMQRRIDAGRRESVGVVRVAEVAVPPLPAMRSAVEGLERESVRSGDEEERECSICLENFAAGMEVIKLPCLHAYHKDCIIRWLERTHFCPFCRFKLPC